MLKATVYSGANATLISCCDRCTESRKQTKPVGTQTSSDHVGWRKRSRDALAIKESRRCCRTWSLESLGSVISGASCLEDKSDTAGCGATDRPSCVSDWALRQEGHTIVVVVALETVPCFLGRQLRPLRSPGRNMRMPARKIRADSSSRICTV